MDAQANAGELDLLKNIPEQDLKDVVASIQEGAALPADALGFDEPAQNSIETMALGFYRGKKYREASLLYGFLLRLNPLRHSAWRGLGACAQARKELEIAAFCYQEAMLRDAEDVISHVYLGEVLCQLGRKDDGISALQKALELAKDKPELRYYTVRARAIVAAGGGVPSRIYLSQKAQQLVAEANASLGASEEYQYDPDRELTLADMKKHPELSSAVKDLEQLLRKGRTTLAEIGSFTEKELDGAYACGVQFLEMDQPVSAMQMAGFLMLVDPYKAKYYRLGGICMQRVKHYPQANHLYHMALALEKDDPRTLVYLGETQILMGNIDAGVEYVKQGIAAAGKNPEVEDVVKRGQVLIKQFGQK